MTSKELLALPLMETQADSICELFHTISKTSSKLEKEKLLNGHQSTLVKDILEDTYNTNVTYGVKQYEVNSIGQFTLDANYGAFHHLLIDLANRKLTGNAAKLEVGDIISKFNQPSQIILARILDRNLKVGAGNAAAEDKGAVKKFPVRLANSYKDVMNRVDIFDGNWLVSRKLDGCRCLAFISSHGGMVEVEFRSRQNKKLTTLSNLVGDYQNLFRNVEGDYVVDGEVCILDEDGNESFKNLMSEITRKDYTIKKPAHIVYDFLTQDEFWGKVESPTFKDRINQLYNIYNSCPECYNVRLLKQQVLTGQNMLNELQNKVKELRWEGLMVAKNTPYQGKRTNDILKIKDFCDGEYVVTGVIIGDQSRNTDRGSWIVKTVAALTIEHKGNVVKVGSGMSYEQRDNWYAHPENIVGKTIGVRYFEETTDKKTGEVSLRFPTLYWVYGDKREI